MSAWLVDATVLLALEDVQDNNHAAAARLMRGPDPVLTIDLAYYEVSNVAIAAWHDPAAAKRLRQLLAALEEAGGMIHADEQLLAAATEIAREHGLSVYDSAYVAAASATGARLVSCDVRDLVRRGMAVIPADATTSGPMDTGR